MRNDLDTYLRETYEGYVEAYDRETNSMPPGSFNWWVDTHAEASIHDAIGIGHFTPEEGVALLEAFSRREA